MAQSGSALAWGASGRRFKSSRPDQKEKLVFSFFLWISSPSMYRSRLISLVLLISLYSLACSSRLGRTPPSGQWVTVVAGDTVSKFAEKYNVALQDIIEINGLRDPSRILVGQVLFIPQFERRLSANHYPTKVEADHPKTHTDLSKALGFRLLNGAPIDLMRELQWPINLSLKDQIGLSSPFGMRKGKPHKGIDIRAPIGTEVKAVLDGDVIRSEFSQGGYGWVIYLRHAGGVETRYAHHKKNLVKVGRFVRAGEVIAQVGNSGRSSGPHLHFELRVNGMALDPLHFLPALDRQSSLLEQYIDVKLYAAGDQK